MSETIGAILEVAMLVCFGFSWPISVVKNIKTHTAKSMSLPFIMLIWSGYIAGIASKFVKGAYHEGMHIFVLVVYFINLLSVSANIVVYFINRSFDKKKKAELGE